MIQNDALNALHAVVEPQLVMNVTLGLGMIAQPPDPIGACGVVGGDETSFARGAETRALSDSELGLVLNDVRNVVAGNIPADSVRPEVRAAASEYLDLQRISHLALTALVFVIGILGTIFIRGRIAPALRARNSVERVLRVGVTPVLGDQDVGGEGVHERRHEGRQRVGGPPHDAGPCVQRLSCPGDR